MFWMTLQFGNTQHLAPLRTAKRTRVCTDGAHPHSVRALAWFRRISGARN